MKSREGVQCFRVVVLKLERSTVALDRRSHLILSGVLREQWEETEAAAREAGLQMKTVTKRGKWVSALGEIAQ